MTATTKPALPEPYNFSASYGGHFSGPIFTAYTADQMHAYADAAIAADREQRADGMLEFDAAVADELRHISTVPYNSYEICKHFAGLVRKKLATPYATEQRPKESEARGADAMAEALMQERERCAAICDDEARIRSEAAAAHPQGSDSRDRCNAAARAAINCAKGIRSGEVVDDAHASQADAEARAVPAGWRLVPVEPTNEMVCDGATHCGTGMLGSYDEAAKVYRAMLAAAPSLAEQPTVWRSHDNTGMRYPEMSDLVGGATDHAAQPQKKG